MAELSETLTLDISAALSAVGDLADALAKTATDFSQALADAVQGAITGIDPAPLTESLSEAVQGADTTVTLESPDTSVLTSDITDAVASADTSVTVGSADASVVTTDIDDAVTSADTAVTVGPVDASEVSTAITDAAAGADTSTTIGDGGGGSGGVSPALTGAEAASAAEGVDALTTANKGLSAANAGLAGSVGGVTSALGPLGIGIAGVTALAGGFFTEAVNEETALNRLVFVYGANVAAVQQVTLANNNFNLSLQEIATSTGASLPGLEQANSKIGSIGSSAGASAPQIAQTANQITALATYLAVTNPALGSADTIMNSLTGSLARGGRSAASLGLSLDASAISAKAHAIATADGRDTVTQFDKVAAGAAIGAGAAGGALAGAARGGASVVAGASAAYRTGGLTGVAQSGASSIAGSLRRSAGAVAPETGQSAGLTGASSAGLPPAWATRMKRSQTLSHGASAATHAVRSADYGGGGTSVDLSEGER